MKDTQVTGDLFVPQIKFHVLIIFAPLVQIQPTKMNAVPGPQHWC
jgi:hypothetical protein